MAARPYAERMQIVVETFAGAAWSSHPRFHPRAEGKTSCSSTPLIAACAVALTPPCSVPRPKKSGSLAVGNRWISSCGKKGRLSRCFVNLPCVTHLDMFTRQVAYAQAQEVAEKLLTAYEQEGYQSGPGDLQSLPLAMVQQVTILRLLPLSTVEDVEAF